MQGFSEAAYITSEQHKEATASRIERDRSDLTKIAAKLEQHSPFSEEVALRNIITGINADGDVNVQDLFVVGRDTVKHMEGQSVFSYSYKRKFKVKTLASARAIKVTDDKTIDPALLFQRFLVVSQSGDLCLDEVMEYELSPYPPSLFDAKYLLRMSDKAQLLDAIRKHATSSDTAILHTIPKTDHYVLDGGSLLHRLKWKEGNTYSSIADSYASFTCNVYGKATVVFDGYNGEPSTKDNTHQRRATKVSNKVDITQATKFVGKKDDFLSNDKNKQALIHLIAHHLQQKGCHVIHAEGDADVDIVTAAISMSSFKSTTLIGEDTDLLVLLLYHAGKEHKDLYFRSDKGQEKPNVYNIRVLKQLLGDDVCSDLLFAHAFSGCDTTSRIFGVGKKSVFQKVVKADPVFRACSNVFCSPKTNKDTIETTGCKAMVSLFNGTPSQSLVSLRYSFLSKKVATAKTFVKSERLPPTPSATKHHSLRSYLQIMQWMHNGDDMDPTEWGWDLQGDRLIPRMTDKNPAPDRLLEIMRCNCSTGCSTFRCSCKKHGLDCTTACGHCQLGTCDNMTQEPVSDDDE